MRVVIDTHVFLEEIMTSNQDLQEELVEKCDKIVLTRKIKNEYTGRSISHGYRVLDILIALQDLEQKNKLVWKGKSACEHVRVENEHVKKDEHLIQAAVAANAKFIITADWTHLLGYQEKIRREFGVDVIVPNLFLRQNESL